MIADKNIRHRNKPNRMSDAEWLSLSCSILVVSAVSSIITRSSLQASATPVSTSGVLQPFRGVEEGSTVSSNHIHQESPAGTCTGISFVDSTPLCVCRNQRIDL